MHFSHLFYASSMLVSLISASPIFEATSSILPELNEGDGVDATCIIPGRCSFRVRAVANLRASLFRSCPEVRSMPLSEENPELVVAVHPVYARNRCHNFMTLQRNDVDVMVRVVGSCGDCMNNEIQASPAVMQKLIPERKLSPEAAANFRATVKAYFHSVS